MKSLLTVKEGKTPYGQRWYINEDCNTLGQFNLFVEHLNPITREIEFDRFSTAYTGTKRGCQMYINREIKSQSDDIAANI